MTNKCPIISQIISLLYVSTLHVFNLARYWLQVPWGRHNSVETCRSVIICEINVLLLVTLQQKIKKHVIYCSLAFIINVVEDWSLFLEAALWPWTRRYLRCKNIVLPLRSEQSSTWYSIPRLRGTEDERTAICGKVRNYRTNDRVPHSSEIQSTANHSSKTLKSRMNKGFL